MSRLTRFSRLIPGAVLALGLALSTTSCAILAPPEPRSGGDGIRAAVHEAKKKPQDQTPLVAGQPDCSDAGVVRTFETAVTVVQTVAVHPADPAPPGPQEANQPPPVENPLKGWSLGFIGGNATVKSGAHQNSSLFGIRVGFTPEPGLSADVALLGVPTRFVRESRLGESLVQPMDVVGEASVRYWLTPDHTFLSLAPVAGFQVGSTLWRYRNPIPIERDGVVEDVASDWINYSGPYAGVSVALVRTAHFELAGTVLAGYRWYDDYTQQGLRNDVFRDVGFTQFRVETSFPF